MSSVEVLILVIMTPLALVAAAIVIYGLWMLIAYCLLAIGMAVDLAASSLRKLWLAKPQQDKQ